MGLGKNWRNLRQYGGFWRSSPQSCTRPLPVSWQSKRQGAVFRFGAFGDVAFPLQWGLSPPTCGHFPGKVRQEMLLLAYLGHLRHRFQGEAGNATSRKRWKAAVSRPRSQIGPHPDMRKSAPDRRDRQTRWKPSPDGGNRDTAIVLQCPFGDDEPSHQPGGFQQRDRLPARSPSPEARTPVRWRMPHTVGEKQKGMAEAMPWNETLSSSVSRASARRPSGPARNQARPEYRGRRSKRGR